MKFTWHKTDTQPETVKKFLQGYGISHRITSRLNKGEGRVIVAGKKRRLAYELTRPVAVTLILPPEKADPKIPANNKPLVIKYEDSNWLVIDKPAGLTSVPGPSNRTDTVVNRVKGYLQAQGAKDLVPHVITRLDRFTSGLVLIAKHRLAQGLINKQVENHQIVKKYTAVVAGHMLMTHGQIDEPLGRIADTFRYGVDATGKPALTEYWVTKQYARATVVEALLHTGRTHQIRAHFTSQGHPLIGDELYGGRMDTPLQRQTLHAHYLQFVDPFTEEQHVLTSDLPMDIQKVLWYLKEER